MNALRGLILGVVACTLAAIAAPQDVRPGLTGSWTGVYEAYPFFIRMTLNADSGELRLEPLVPQNSIGRPPMGVLRVTVSFDAGARTLLLAPGPDAYRALGVMVPQFYGVLDDERQVVGGVLVGGPTDASPHFIMARTEAADAAFVKKMKDVLGDSGIGPARIQNPIAGIKNPFGGGGQNKLREWAAQFTKEYPEVDPYRTESGSAFMMTRNLFRDDYFKPHFGKTYDQLGRGDFTKYTADLRAVPPPRSNFPEERANGTLRSLERAFSLSIGTYTAPDVTLSVLAMRPMEAWRAQALGRVQGAPATIEGLRTIAASQAAEQNALSAFWPSERQGFADAVTGARARVAGPVLTARVNELIASSTSFAGAAAITTALEASRAAVSRAATGNAAPGRGRGPGAAPMGRPAVVTPSAVDDSLAGLMALVSPDARTAHMAKLEARVTELVDAEAQRDRAAIARLGDGLPALEAGSRLSAEMTAKYRSFPAQPSVRAAFEALARQRGPLLGAAEAPLATRVRAARSTADVDAIVRQYLGASSDAADPAGRRVLQAAQQQRAQLAAAEATAEKAREEERRRAASPCARARTDPDEMGGPTEKELCLVMEDLLAGKEAAIKDMEGSCKGLRPDSNPFSAFFCLFGTLGSGYHVSMGNFRKLACSPAAPLPGYFCDYSSVMSLDQRGTGMIPPLPSGIGTARFIKSDGRWLMIPR
jgi:hypothetical protein